jgi:hypothetical protein
MRLARSLAWPGLASSADRPMPAIDRAARAPSPPGSAGALRSSAPASRGRLAHGALPPLSAAVGLFFSASASAAASSRSTISSCCQQLPDCRRPWRYEIGIAKYNVGLHEERGAGRGAGPRGETLVIVVKWRNLVAG